MAQEIERKFKVKKTWQPTSEGEKIAQGYLAANDAATVRVRIKGARGFLTVKGATHGITRQEFEYEIPLADAEEMLALCSDNALVKRRFVEKHGENLWEIDVFEGKNAPLIIAEIELPTENAEFVRPSWLDEEVSSDPRYFNSYLAKFPFAEWSGGKP